MHWVTGTRTKEDHFPDAFSTWMHTRSQWPVEVESVPVFVMAANKKWASSVESSDNQPKKWESAVGGDTVV